MIRNSQGRTPHWYLFSGRMEGVTPDSRRNERLLVSIPTLNLSFSIPASSIAPPQRWATEDACRSNGSTSPSASRQQEEISQNYRYLLARCRNTLQIGSTPGMAPRPVGLWLWQDRKNWRSPPTLRRPSCPMKRGASFASPPAIPIERSSPRLPATRSWSARRQRQHQRVSNEGDPR